MHYDPNDYEKEEPPRNFRPWLNVLGLAVFVAVFFFLGFCSARADPIMVYPAERDVPFISGVETTGQAAFCGSKTIATVIAKVTEFSWQAGQQMLEIFTVRGLCETTDHFTPLSEVTEFTDEDGDVWRMISMTYQGKNGYGFTLNQRVVEACDCLAEEAWGKTWAI